MSGEREMDELLKQCRDALIEAKYFFDDDFPDGSDGPCAVTGRYRAAFKSIEALIPKLDAALAQPQSKGAVSGEREMAAEKVAEAIWQAEAKRALGRRLVGWDDVAEEDKERYRFTAREVLAALAQPQLRSEGDYNARDHFLSLVDASNWGDWMEGEFYKGYSEAMASVHEGVMDWWDELSAKTLAQPQLRDAPDDWKTIESAPKNGVPVDAWAIAGPGDSGFRVANCWANDDGVSVPAGTMLSPFCEITHWRPIPPSPSEPKEDKSR